MPTFLLHNYNLNLFYFLVSIIILTMCIPAYWMIIDTIHYNKKVSKIDVILTTIITCILLIFTYTSYNNYHTLQDYKVIKKQTIVQYYQIEKVGNSLLFTEKEDHPALINSLSLEIKEENESEYILLIDNKKESIKKSDISN